MSAPLRVFETAEALGEAAARRVLAAVTARESGVLGCPGGRSARTTYAALGRLAVAEGADLSGLHLVMMDEYVTRTGVGWAPVRASAHYSCAGFGEREIRAVLNAGLPPGRRVRRLHVPDPNDPAAYEALIETLGGVDLFLLASGASDGHVAFNPPGTPADAAARVMELAETTRRDNLATFPAFRDLDEVPRFGVTVGPATIVRHSRAALLILIGAEKAEALARITAANAYDPAWPASVIHACADGQIFADRAAAGTAHLGIGQAVAEQAQALRGRPV